MNPLWALVAFFVANLIFCAVGVWLLRGSIGAFFAVLVVNQCFVVSGIVLASLRGPLWLLWTLIVPFCLVCLALYIKMYDRRPPRTGA